MKRVLAGASGEERHAVLFGTAQRHYGLHLPHPTT
jgi:hypothetical protein